MAKNPLDEFLEEVELEKDAAPKVNLYQRPTFQELKSTQDKELDMWNQWDSGGRKSKDLRPLMNSMRPLIQSSVNTYRGRVRYIPDEALEAEFNNHAVKAIKSYNPNRGAKLSTWVKSNLRKGGRFVRTYQNVGRIVEDRAANITDFNNAKAHLAEMKGRPATDSELVRYLNATSTKNKRWTTAEVQRMTSELRADIMSSSFESDPTTWSPDVDGEIMAFLGEELTPAEKQVFQYMQTPGATQGKTGLIAQKLKWSPSKVSRLRKAIERKALKYRQALS